MKQDAATTIGAITMLMMRSEFMSGLTIAQLREYAVPPVRAGLAVTAMAKPDAPVSGPIGFALFARVNDDWHNVLLKPDYDTLKLPESVWTSGDHPWLIDFLAHPEAAGPFVMNAARAMFPTAETINVRQRETDGTIKVSETKLPTPPAPTQ